MSTRYGAALVAVVAMAAAWQGASDAAPPAQADLVAGPHLVAGPVERVPGTTGGGRLTVVAVDGAGTATAVWRQTYRNADGTKVYAMRAARRGIGGRWSAARTIGCASLDTCAAAVPKVGVSRAGVVTVAWTDGTNVTVVRRPVGGPWGTPHVIKSLPGPSSLDLAVARDGDVVLTWDAQVPGAGSQVQAAVRRAGGSWRHAVTVGRGHSPLVAVDAKGDALVVYGRGLDFVTLWGSRHVLGQGWSTPRPVVPPASSWPGGGQAWDVAMGPKGQALVSVDGYDDSGVYAREMSPNGTWGTFRLASRTTYACEGVSVIDSRGIGTVAYLDPCDYPSSGRVARMQPGEPWRSRTLLPGSGGYPPQLVVNARNDLAVAFGGRTLLRPHGSTWSAPLRAHGGTLAILPYGSALRMWWDAQGLKAQRIYLG